MIKRLILISMAVGVLSGCEKKDPAPSSKPPSSGTRPAANASTPEATPDSATPAEPVTPTAGDPPPPPGSIDPNAPVVAGATLMHSDGKAYSDLEALNYALAGYSDDTVGIVRPPLKDLSGLVTAGLIKSVPKPPPGKKFLLNYPQRKVTLVDDPTAKK